MVEKKNKSLEQRINKILHILNKYKTISSLNYLLENINNTFLTFEITREKGFKNQKKINNSISFSVLKNSFQLYIVNMIVQKNNDGNKFYLGSFLMYYNNNLVLETSVIENKTSLGKISLIWDVNNLKYAKLCDWVELIPAIVEKEKKASVLQQKKIGTQEEEKFKEKMYSKFDLGKYK